MRAYFISTPKTYRDLLKPHLPEAEREYEIVKTIELSGINYENFSEDMLVNRQFIEDNAALCEDGDVLRCLLVKRRGKHEGISSSGVWLVCEASCLHSVRQVMS